MKSIKKQYFYYELTFALLAIVLGTLFHFIYKWSDYHYLIAFISPINESTWEHLKMLFFPFLFLTFIEYFMIGKNFSSFVTAKTIGCFAGLLFIVAFFYTYTGIIGTNYLAMDILTFILGVLVCYFFSWYLSACKKTGNHTSNILCLCLLLLLAFFFAAFTNHTPNINLFKSIPSEVLKN